VAKNAPRKRKKPDTEPRADIHPAEPTKAPGMAVWAKGLIDELAGHIPSDRQGSEVAASAVSQFARCLFEPRDLVEVRPLPYTTERFWCRAGDIVSHVHDLAELNSAGRNLYIGANPRLRHGGTE
jgi:hypothetical protein